MIANHKPQMARRSPADRIRPPAGALTAVSADRPMAVSRENEGASADTPIGGQANDPNRTSLCQKGSLVAQGDDMENIDVTTPLHSASLQRLSDHLVWMRRRRLAAETIRTRNGHVLRFLRWAQQQPRLKDGDPDVIGRTLYDADSDLIDAWQATLAAQGASNERAAISHLRQLYIWAIREDYLTKDPTVKAILPRLVRRRPRPIHENRLALAWRAADKYMRAILALAAMAGLRACEIARLSWTDVDLEGEMIVTGKGGHQRAIWIADCTLLVEVLTEIRVKNRGPVIPRLDGKAGHNTANTIDRRGNAFLHNLDIEETLHRLRHRFGTIGYRACVDPVAMMKLMGHADLSATIIYADSGSDSAQAAIEATGKIRGIQSTPGADPVVEADPEQDGAGMDRLAS